MNTVAVKRVGLALSLSLILMFALANAGFAAEQNVEIEASIAQRLIFSIDEGGSVSLVADPMDNPTDTAASGFNVKTNVGSYSISANFGDFTVENTDHDLIENENFRIRSIPPADGDAVFDWTVPSDEMAVLSGETGYTNLQTTVVEYQLNVDFSVPTGSASTTIVLTATPSI